MPQPLTAGLPPELQLSAGYILRVNALDQATGAEVSGVMLSDVSLFVSLLSGNLDEGTPAPLLVPSGEPV